MRISPSRPLPPARPRLGDATETSASQKSGKKQAPREAGASAKPPPRPWAGEPPAPGPGLAGFWSQITYFFKRLFSPGPPPVDPATVPLSVEANGAPDRLVNEALSVAALLCKRADVAQGLRDAHVTMVIIPKGKRLTDLPQFAGLAGQKTFDGRAWEDVRGVAGQWDGDRYLFAVGEENLDDHPLQNRYGMQSVVVHELSHAVHQVALPWEETSAIAAAFDARRAAGGPWTDDYAANNEYEYWGQASSSYFGRNGSGGNGPEWLRKYDKAVYDLCVKVYGPVTP